MCYIKSYQKKISNIIITINYLCVLININKIDISDKSVIKLGDIFKKIYITLIFYN